MQFIISSFIFFILFFFLWNVRLPMLSSVKETWIWNKEGAFGTFPPGEGEDPLKVLNGYRLEGRYYSFATNRFVPFEEPFKLDYALLSQGYLEYQKIGDEVNFYSDSGELFWKKPINSYPRSGYFGTPVLYLSGDNNTVFVLDNSGNVSGLGELNGRFLTDYDFAQNGKGAVVLFSGGEIYRIDEKGNKIFSADLSSDKNESFFKSVSLSPNGSFTLVHFSSKKKDYLMILDEKGEATDEWELSQFYPHKIYLSIGNRKNSVLNSVDTVQFFKEDKLVWEEKKEKAGSVYQANFAFPSGFAYGLEKEIVFLDAEGNKIRKKNLPSSEFPIRFFSGKEPNTAYLETKKDIYQIRLFE